VCGTAFIVNAHELKHRRATFCSLQCYGLFQRGKHRRDWSLRCSKHRCQNEHFQEGYCREHYERQLVIEHEHPAPEYAIEWRFSKKRPYLEGKSQYREGKAEYLRELRLRLKVDVLAYYAKGKPSCAVCGFDDMRALCLDHINHNGAEHRAEIKQETKNQGRGVGASIFRWLKNHGYPDGFQVLCANCNMIKEHEYRAVRKLE
jgi:hypothetical protein